MQLPGGTIHKSPLCGRPVAELSSLESGGDLGASYGGPTATAMASMHMQPPACGERQSGRRCPLHAEMQEGMGNIW